MGNFTGFEKSQDFYIHPRLGQIKRIQKQEGPQMIQHKIVVESQDIVQQWISSIKKLYNTPCQNILFLPKTHYCQKIGYCGHNCQVFLLFEDYMFCLKDQIKNRRIIKRPFPESCIWQLLYKLMKVENILQKLELKIGNLSTNNIIVNQDGDMRIVCQYSWPCIQNHIINENQQKILLRSPQQIKNFNTLLQKIIKKKESIKNQILQTQVKLQLDKKIYNDNISEVFIIGIILLQISSLYQSQTLYTNNGINQKQIIKRLSSLQQNYSLPLITLIFQMLRIQPKNRIKSQKIITILKKHQQAILTHKKFHLQQKLTNPFITPSLLPAMQPQKNIQHDELNIKKLRNRSQSKKKWSKVRDFFPLMCLLKSKQIKSTAQMKQM